MFANDFDAAFAEMDALARAFMGRGFDGRHGLREAPWASRTPEFVAGDHGWTLHADLPGVTDDHLDVTVDKGVLTLEATRTASSDDDTWTLKHREREATVLRNRFRLPERADVEGIEAELSDGVLTLTVPRQAEAPARRITVRTR